MDISIAKVITISALMFTSFNANATIITGGLSYDSTGTGIITGTNGKAYVGWEEGGIKGTLLDMISATQVGGEFQGFHIARRKEAVEFYKLATGSNAISDYGRGGQFEKFEAPHNMRQLGDLQVNFWDTTRYVKEGNKWVAYTTTSHSISSLLTLSYIVDDLRTWNSYGHMVFRDYQSFTPAIRGLEASYYSYRNQSMEQNIFYQLGGPEQSFESVPWSRTWLLVSGPSTGPVLVPEPTSYLLLILGLLGLRFTHKKNKPVSIKA